MASTNNKPKDFFTHSISTDSESSCNVKKVQSLGTIHRKSSDKKHRAVPLKDQRHRPFKTKRKKTPEVLSSLIDASAKEAKKSLGVKGATTKPQVHSVGKNKTASLKGNKPEGFAIVKSFMTALRKKYSPNGKAIDARVREERRERKRAVNRQSAQRKRMRQKEQIDELMKKCQELKTFLVKVKAENSLLEEHVDQLQKEQAQLIAGIMDASKAKPAPQVSQQVNRHPVSAPVPLAQAQSLLVALASSGGVSPAIVQTLSDQLNRLNAQQQAQNLRPPAPAPSQPALLFNQAFPSYLNRSIGGNPPTAAVSAPNPNGAPAPVVNDQLRLALAQLLNQNR